MADLDDEDRQRQRAAMPRCETCRWYKGESDSRYPGFGECRFNAPARSDRCPWPIVKGERDWCGRHVPIIGAELKAA